jgi:hypothetical protein
MEVLRRGVGGGGTTKVLLTLCELVIKQSNKVNKLEREHNMQPQLPSLAAGTYLANKETRLGPAPENGRGGNGGSMFKSFGIQSLQPWEREEKKARLVDQEEDNSKWSQEMKERSRRDSNIMIRGLKQDSEQEDGYRRNAHNIISSPALQRANAEMKTIIRVQEDVTPMQAKRF